jgi:outer membrane immunogenic protein
MKKILLASVATSLLMAGAASAADLPRRSAPVAPIAPIMAVPVFTWTGFYVGVNAGYGFSDSNDDAVFVPQGTFLNTPGAPARRLVRHRVERRQRE